MQSLTVHQQVHGYRHGHRLLSGSTELSAEGADTVDRLSDLSGPMVPGLKVQPYWTLYPLAGDDVYAVGRTWLDESAGRSGCVMTHTVFVPLEWWANASDVTCIANLVCGSRKAVESRDLNSPLTLHRPRTTHSVASQCGVPIDLSEFATRYFSDGVRPIVWFDCDDPNYALWTVVSFLWPRMRQNFAGTTLALQPRLATGSYFDLMFAPSMISSRFHRIPQEAFVGSAPLSQQESGYEDWIAEMLQDLNSTSSATAPRDSHRIFLDMLPPEPTAARVPYLIRDLQRRSAVSPLASIAILDLIESVCPLPHEGVREKDTALRDSLLASRGLDPQDRLHMLYLLSERLRRKSFTMVNLELLASSLEEARSLIRQSPSLVAAVDERVMLFARPEVASAFLGAVLDGLESASAIHASRFGFLYERPELGGAVLRLRPALGPTLLRVGRSLGVEFIPILTGWIQQMPDATVRESVAAKLLPHLIPDIECPLFREVLRNIGCSGVPWALDILTAGSAPLLSPMATSALGEEVAQRCAEEVVRWARVTRSWSKAAPAFISMAYSKDSSGLRQLLHDPEMPGNRKSSIWSSFVGQCAHGRLPEWLVDCAKRDVSALSIFVESDLPFDSEAISAIDRLLEDCRELPLCESDCIASELVRRFETIGSSLRFVRQQMRGLIRSYVSGGMSRTSLKQRLSSAWSKQWLTTASESEIVGMLSGPEEVSAWRKYWDCVADISTGKVASHGVAVRQIVRSLAASRLSDWTPEVAGRWCEVIRCIQSEGRQADCLRMCVDALTFGFSNVREAVLGEVVVVAFPIVYQSIMSGETADETSELFGFLDWDRAKRLRMDLVHAFMSSAWRPGGLAITAFDASILGKVFKRVRRQWGGEDYLNRMIGDLVQRVDEKPAVVASELQRMLSSPSFFEPWD